MSVTKTTPLVISCNYFDCIYQDDFISDAKMALKNIHFDTMVGIGLSGILAVSKLSPAMKKYALYLRKSTEASHAYSYEEGTIGDNWIIVDDLISTGSTFKVIYERMREMLTVKEHKSKFVGIYLYQHQEFRTMKALEEVFERKVITK